MEDIKSLAKRINALEGELEEYKKSGFWSRRDVLKGLFGVGGAAVLGGAMLSKDAEALVITSDRISGLAAPEADNDAVRKQYVDPIQSDVTGSRAFGTEYTNNTGRFLWIDASIYTKITETSSTPLAGGYIGESSATTKYSEVGGHLVWNYGPQSWQHLITLIVPPGWKYKITSPGGNTNTIVAWWETEMF